MVRHSKAIFVFGIFFMLASLFLLVGDCFAALSTDNIMDKVLEKYATAAQTWAGSIQKHASYLFVSLATISLVWTFVQLYFRRSSFTEFFGEAARFTIFTGLFLWFLNNAPNFAEAIFSSLQQIGTEASGLHAISPSTIVDMAFKVLQGVINNFSMLNMQTSIIGGIVAILNLLVLALVAINMLLQLCSAWVLAYAGIFFLGFGGSRWTSDMAINYFKTVLGVGTSLMTMTLLVGIGQGIINDCVQNMVLDPPELGELSVLLVFSITLLLLTDKLPSMVAGIITGSSIGQSLGAGAFGAGAAMGAAMTAMAMGKAGLSAAGASGGGLLQLSAKAQSMGQRGLSAMYQAMQPQGQSQGQGQDSSSSGGGSGSPMDSMGIKPSGGQKRKPGGVGFE